MRLKRPVFPELQAPIFPSPLTSARIPTTLPSYFLLLSGVSGLMVRPFAESSINVANRFSSSPPSWR
ncbi:MAG: hypothetical protein U0528_06755 [Anaerolineae bacterium]